MRVNKKKLIKIPNNIRFRVFLIDVILLRALNEWIQMNTKCEQSE